MQRIFLIFREIFSNIWIGLIVFISVVLSVLSSGAFLIIENNFNSYINEKFASSIPPGVIKVTPKAAPSLGFLNLPLAKPAGTIIEDRDLAKIRTLKGVKGVYALMGSQIPMEARISIFGLNYRTDLVCLGAPYDYISKNLSDNKGAILWKRWKPGKEMPVLIPDILLDAYNNSMAEPNGLPKISKEFVKGRKLQILFGKSSIKTIDGFEVENATVFGFTEKIASICLVVPIDAVKYYNRRFKGNSGSTGFLSIYVETTDHSAFLEVNNKIKKSGFIVESEKSLSREILALKETVQMGLQALRLIIVLICMAGIVLAAMVAVTDRIEYYRILRVLGASKVFIVLSVWIKYAVIGLCASLLGIIILNYSGRLLITAISIPGFKLNPVLIPSTYNILIGAGVLLPVIASIPALFRLFTKTMTQD